MTKGKMNQEGNQLLRLFSFGPFPFFCTQYTIELVVCVHHNPLTGYHRSKAGQKGYGKHQQQVRWYIEYKKKKRDQMSTNAKVNYPQESFSLIKMLNIY